MNDSNEAGCTVHATACRPAGKQRRQDERHGTVTGNSTELLLAWDHVRRRLPFLADFLENILTGMAAGARASGWSGGRGWGASALVMGQLHRAPPTATCAQVARAARAL